jgi:hypothetical protein
MKIEKNCLNALNCISFQLLMRKSMFEAMYSDINPLKSGLRNLTGQPNSPNGRSAKVKDGIISEIKLLGTISVDRYDIKPLVFYPILYNLSFIWGAFITFKGEKLAKSGLAFDIPPPPTRTKNPLFVKEMIKGF